MNSIPKRRALQFVVLLGIVSLLADMAYEGARSVTGPYLALLGASATVVGTVAGFGELIGLSLRLVFGWLSDRTGRYWTFTLLGYGLKREFGLGDREIFEATVFVALRLAFSTVNDALGAAPDKQVADEALAPVRAAVAWGRAPAATPSR